MAGTDELSPGSRDPAEQQITICLLTANQASTEENDLVGRYLKLNSPIEVAGDGWTGPRNRISCLFAKMKPHVTSR